MNYSLKTPLSCFLALSATAAMAAGGTENSLATLGEPFAVQAALPSVHVDVSGQQKKLSERVSLEGFWPFMQQEEQLLFLQGGWLRQQQRNLLSAGLGWRYFPETDWGVGSNLFYDQDITRQHSRIGLGAEAWWQSLTLSANGYLPASSWRTAPDLKGYQERPAKGYDLTLKGYLPMLPHLGASVRYAHYLGDEVALSDSKHRQQNPKQWRWGIDVTPIPLLTLAYHQSPGLSGDAKHQISAALTYRFALPLSQQLDPTQVATFHSAQGQRLARVQREQLMALQYAKIAEPKPPKVASKVVPKELTSTEVMQYIEEINKVMEALKDEKQAQEANVEAHWGALLAATEIKTLHDADTSLYNTPWGDVASKSLEEKELQAGLKTLKEYYTTNKAEFNKLTSKGQYIVKGWLNGLDRLQALSDRYIAVKEKFDILEGLKGALLSIETGTKNLKEFQKEIAELNKVSR